MNVTTGTLLNSKSEAKLEDQSSALPSGWVLTTLGEAFVWGSGGTPKRSITEYFGGCIPWAVIGDLKDGIVSETSGSITKLGLANSSARMVSAGSVLLAMYGSIGKLGIAGTVLTTNQAIVFTKTDPIHNKYLFWYLRFARSELVALGRGDTQSNISQTVIKGFSFLLAPLPEQRRIVAEIEKQFTRLDAAEAALERVQANLKRYRASVLKAACEGKLALTEAELAEAEGRDYEDAEQLLERILAERRARWESQEKRRGKYKGPATLDTSDLPELPAGWIWSSLGEAFEVFVGATPRRSRPEYWGGDISWVSSSEVAFTRIKKTRECTTEEGLKHSSMDLHPPGTVLLGMIGEGKTRGQVSILDIPACNSQNSAAIRVSESRLPPEYVFYYLWGQYDATRQIGSGNNQPALNKSRVQEIPFPLPPIAEQHRIVSEMDRHSSVIHQTEATVEVCLKRIGLLRQSILKQAFCGRLVPQDPDDEPASALLERIKVEREAARSTYANRPRSTRRRSRK